MVNLGSDRFIRQVRAGRRTAQPVLGRVPFAAATQAPAELSGFHVQGAGRGGRSWSEPW